MNHYQEQAIDKLESLKGQKDYAEKVLVAGGLEEWEAKEYSKIWEGCVEKIIKQEQHIELCIKEEYFN